MRRIKMLGIAAIMALAVLATAGATTGSADTFCQENVGENSECPAEKRIEEEGRFAGLTGSLQVLSPTKELLIECESEVLGTIGKNLGPHKGLLATVSKLTLTSCSTGCNKATGINFPYKLQLEALALDVFLSKGEGAAGPPVVRWEECFGGFGTCSYEFEATEPLFRLLGDTLTANEVPLKRLTGLFCTALDLVDATYLVRLDTISGEHTNLLYLASLP